MGDYRLYFLDAQGPIHRAVELQCDDDEDAVRRSAGHADGRAMELWQRARVVRRFEPCDLSRATG